MGQHLPERLPVPVVMLVAFALGVLVTYAEPAIAAIRPLAALVDPQSAPYLYYILNQQQEITVSVCRAGATCFMKELHLCQGCLQSTAG